MRNKEQKGEPSHSSSFQELIALDLWDWDTLVVPADRLRTAAVLERCGIFDKD